ncbi:hypothetical protein NVS08_17210 [Enterobacter kobei]|uniref:hypothetical protein n=1 Tax=Enterobacter kobei TaxID=208224 RepID=UPI00254AA249|nr:hypothetical protein [Enterobacter kobei]ELT0446805.1 hypothetical protein [Enterobacter hormaechei subsp. xiangfangensis]ELX8366043.1 hypothetical protein [Enterobacter hormaechei]MDK9887290.1 hypothetical protein [Enterobacter kobei]
MSTITKEQAQSVSDLKAGYTLGHADVAILNDLARIALASLEAEPVAWRCGSTVTVNKPVADDWKRRGFDFHPLYAAPPVSAFEIKDLEHFISFWKKVQEGQMSPGKNDIDHTVWFLEGLSDLTVQPAPVSVPDDVLAAMQKVARIRLDLNDFDGDKRGILDCLSDAEEALIEVVNRHAAMLNGEKS